MTTRFKSLFFVLIAAITLGSCFVDDPGPRQETKRQYTVVDFDRLEMGSGLHIDVEYGNFFSVKANGDRRNIDDLVVRTEGTTLVIDYRHFRERRHDTFIEITMPELHSVTFSGGSDSRVEGFSSAETFDVYLSGGSVCQLNLDTHKLKAVLSGASYLKAGGTADELNADISGASAFKGFNMPFTNCELLVSGASDGEVTVSDALKVTATGASHVVYRGNPSLISEVSGSSSVHAE